MPAQTTVASAASSKPEKIIRPLEPMDHESKLIGVKPATADPALATRFRPPSYTHNPLRIIPAPSAPSSSAMINTCPALLIVKLNCDKALNAPPPGAASPFITTGLNKNCAA